MKTTCPSCLIDRHDFTFADDGRCTVCHIDEARSTSVVAITIADVRQRRDTLLTRCDWTQLPDVQDSVREQWASVRQALRDITDQSVEDAWSALEDIDAASFR